MNRLARTITIALGVALISAAAATVAQATPSKTTVCTSCHSGTNIPVTITPVSIGSTSATYNVSAPGANYLSVFRGATKVSTIAGATGSFTVAPGSTYTVYAVKGPSTTTGVGKASVTPVAPPVDATAPVTTSDALATYTGSATINLSATDGVGGSGVATTYYSLDGATAVAGTKVTLSTVGAHTLDFWSVDVAGNVESPVKSVDFSIESVVVVDPLQPILSLQAGATTIAYGGSGLLTGSLGVDAPVAGATVALEYSTDGLTWARSADVYVTDAFGAVSATVKPTASTQYRFVFDGDASLLAASSATVTITPRASLSTPVAPTSVVRGRTFTVYSYLKPRHTAGTYPVTLQFYRYQSGKWVLRKSITAKAANYSTYTKVTRSLSLPYTGKWRVRAYHAADASHAASYSAYRTLTVR